MNMPFMHLGPVIINTQTWMTHLQIWAQCHHNNNQKLNALCLITHWIISLTWLSKSFPSSNTKHCTNFFMHLGFYASLHDATSNMSTVPHNDTYCYWYCYYFITHWFISLTWLSKQQQQQKHFPVQIQHSFMTLTTA